MFKRRLSFVALLAAFALVVVACGDDDTGDTTATTAAATTTTASADPTTTTTAAPATTAPAETTAPPATDAPPQAILGCQVSDVAGIDDKSFNETAWKGMEQAEAEIGAETAFLESQDATDYRPNIDAFIAQGCDVIITVGFLLADDTAAAAKDNPDQPFGIIDFPVGPFAPWQNEGEESFPLNVRGITFSTNEAAFLAGYLAAGVSESGVIGTFGGINIPPVTVFMDGFMRGAAHYDEVNGTATTVLGWDGADGLFTGNFESLEDGRAFAVNLMDEGADVILPVAGPVGLGSGAAIQEANAAGANVMLIGVDADMFLSAPELGDILLTSIQKNMDIAVFNTMNNIATLGSLGNQYNGTLANGGVGLAPFHDLEGSVPAELAAELAALEADIISGDVSTTPPEE